MRYILIFIMCLSMTACQLPQVYTQNKNDFNTLQLQSISSDITNLIKKQFLAKTDTLSIVYTGKVSENLALQYLLVKDLKAQGYAVQHVLPEEFLQAGDKRAQIQGTKVELYVAKLNASSFVQVSLNIGVNKYSRAYQLTNIELIPVSPWSKLNGLNNI